MYMYMYLKFCCSWFVGKISRIEAEKRLLEVAEPGSEKAIQLMKLLQQANQLANQQANQNSQNSQSQNSQNNSKDLFIHPDGAFLVRHSESAPGEFSISVK